MHDGRRQVIVAVDPAAAAFGLRAGMAVPQAMAIMPELQVIEAEPEADADALDRLARWCHRITPLASADATDGLWLDITGCAHLFESETTLLRDLVTRFGRDRLQARVAVADTPGAAHAVARHTVGAKVVVIAAGMQGAAIATLPVAALRLSSELQVTLRRLGFEQVRHLTRIPRALLAQRFGPLPGLRMDQAHGTVQESLTPLLPEYELQRRISFLEPLVTAEALRTAIAYLVGAICEEMERRSLGARQLDLLFERVDNHVAAVRVGMVSSSRDARHLARMLEERLDTVDPGLGVESMRLVVPLAESLRWKQQEAGAPQEVARLLDQLTNRLGTERVYQAAPVESSIPERGICKQSPNPRMPGTSLCDSGGEPATCHSPSMTIADATPMQLTSAKLVFALPEDKMIGAIQLKTGHLRLVNPVSSISIMPSISTKLCDQTADRPEDLEPPLIAWKRSCTLHRASKNVAPTSWPNRLQAPARLLDPPRPVEALAALPDQPPVAFTWRRRRYRVLRADGPERIHGEWWCNDVEGQSVRDYFQVEAENGQRFWLFRCGNGMDPRMGDLSWFLHGLF